MFEVSRAPRAAAHSVNNRLGRPLFPAASFLLAAFATVLFLGAAEPAVGGARSVVSSQSATSTFGSSAPKPAASRSSSRRPRMQELRRDRKRTSRYSVEEAGTVTHLTAYVDGRGSGKGASQKVTFVLYGDASGRPRRLLGSTSAHRILDGSRGRWVTLALKQPVAITAGRYHLGIHSGGRSNVARHAVDKLGMRIYATYVPDAAIDLQAASAKDAAPKKDTRPPGRPTIADTTPPSVPGGMAFTGTTETTVGLRWDASTDNVGVAGYELYRDGQRVGSTQSLSYKVSGLRCGTAYTFALVAYDAAGNRSNIAYATGTASTQACPDGSAPTAPGGLTKTAATQTGISLSWNASSDNVAVTGYRVYRNGTATGTTSGTTHTASGLSCNTSYTFAVEAYDAAGNTSARTSITAATSACPTNADTTPPSVPDGMAFTGTTETTVGLRWNASTDNTGVAGYRVYRDGTSVGTTQGTSHTFTGLRCGTAYTFAVVAYDAAGNQSNIAYATGTTSTQPCADSSAPTAPGGLTKTAATQTGISLSWNASSDNIAVTGYRVYRNGTATGTTSGTTHTASGLSCNTSYTFAVEAYDAAGNTSARTSITAATSACATADTTPPSVPGGMAFTGATETTVGLRWNASTDNVGVAGYRVYRDGTAVGTTQGTSFTFTGLTCDTSYTFSVEAYDAAGNASSRALAAASTRTAACPGSPGGGGGGDTGGSGPVTSAQLWVDTDGGSCSRQASPAAYNSATACGTFDAAYAAARAGDVVGIKAGTYPGNQGAGSDTKGGVVTMIGEDGARIVDGNRLGGDNTEGLALAGNVTLRNVDVGGYQPFLYLGGNTNTTWEDSTFEAAQGDRTCNYTEPILILATDDEPAIGDITLRNVTIGTQTHDETICSGGTPFHLEQVRIDQNVDGVTFDRVSFEKCPDCGSGQLFITTPNTSTTDPSGIVVQNSIFKGSGNYAWQMHSNVDRCVGYRFLYNTFSQEQDTECATTPDVQWVGNLGPRSSCDRDGTFTRNVWQGMANPNCGSTDKWVSGANYSTSALGLDSQYRLMAGSPAIDAGETTGTADVCTSSLHAIDIDGQARPTGGGKCDAGADER